MYPLLGEAGRDRGERIKSNKSLRPKESSVKLFKQLWFCTQTGQTEVLHHIGEKKKTLSGPCKTDPFQKQA